MAEAVSNAELDLHAMSRDGKNATYRVIPTEDHEGNRVEQILGEPAEATDKPEKDTPAKPAAKKAAGKK